MDMQIIPFIIVEFLMIVYFFLIDKRFDKIDDAIIDLKNAIKELKKTQTESKRPEKVRLWRNEYVGDCPDCHRIVRFAQKHCHNCTRLLDWTEVLEMPHDEDEEDD